jgi:DNA-binding XRE family transcriptional regulator
MAHEGFAGSAENLSVRIAKPAVSLEVPSGSSLPLWSWCPACHKETSMTTTTNTPLRDKRIAAGLTQSALAIAAGVRSSSLCRIEKGESCNQQTALKLAAALNLTVEQLFPGFQRLRKF